MNKNKLGSSLNKQEEILNFLKSDLPEVFSEGKIDCKKLKQTLGEEVDDGNERYGLSWAGKSNCFKVIQEQTTATLKLAKDESVNFDQTQNLFIEGDNLEVLKVLQRSYYGKVKMIYIDPPYNTGGDFIYNDNFRKSKQEEMMDTGEMDGNGDLVRSDGLFLNRRDSNGHFHSDWLNMMYSRLFLARNLLCQDGVIFISIDDNEVHNLKIITNEIFGEENFVGTITWEKRTKAQNTETAKDLFRSKTEYILVYKKSVEKMRFNLEVNGKKEYDLEDERGKYRLKIVEEMSAWGMRGRQTMIFPIHGVMPKEGKQWKVGQELVNNFEERNDIELNDGKIYFKIRPEDESDEKNLPFWSHFFDKDTYGTAEVGKSELSDILGTDAHGFETVKPVRLIKKLLFHVKQTNGVSINSGDVVLDFFSGSGTTAQAVMEQNAKDGGSRKWVCVQLPELCAEDSEAYKAGFKTIAEIGKERIRRAGKKISEEGKNKVDTGFKVLKLDKSNFKVWQGKYENAENLLNAMAEFVDNVQKGSREENILFELILKSGLDLNVPVEEKEFGGEKYYSLDGGKLIVYLGKEITKELSEEIQKAKPEKFICLDGCFQNNDQLKTNISLQMEQEKIDFKVI
jgi:adenine-specific DNA-methyltransferase